MQSSDDSGILLDYCARKLDAASVALIEQHLEACPDCRRFAESQQQIWTALDEWEAAPISDEFDTRLYARINVQQSRNWFHRLANGWLAWKPALPLAAACAAALALLLNIPSSAPVADQDVQGRARIEVLETEEIERALEDVEMLRQFSTPPQQTF